MQITFANTTDAPRLFEVWEASVRATHDFLDAAAIDALAPIVRDLLHSFSPIHCVRDENGLPFAFMGTQGSMLEMLFIHPSRRGQGAGRLLTNHAIDRLGVTEVDVNEDNRQALGFYERLGFRSYRRSPLDGFGNPYPILHLRLEREGLSDEPSGMAMQPTQKMYEAIICGPDPDVPGKRVSVVAESLTDARTKLEQAYGKGTVFNLHNETDASARRSASGPSGAEGHQGSA